MNKTSGIYQIRNMVNGHIYIGSAVDVGRRWRTHRRHLRQHIHSNSHLQRAWIRYGEDCFEFSVVEICDDPTLLVEKEQEHIDNKNPQYNILRIAGSVLGFRHSEKTKKKLSDAMKGRASVSWNKGKRGVYSSETLQKMSAARIGMVFSDEHRLNLSNAHKGKPSSWKGKTPSAESRKKMSDAHKGKIPWNKNRVPNDGEVT